MRRALHEIGPERGADQPAALQVDEWPKRFRQVPVLEPSPVPLAVGSRRRIEE